MEWLLIGGIVLLYYFYSQKKQVEPPVLTSPISSTPSPQRNEGPTDQVGKIVPLPPERSENFLENPALRMMSKQLIGQAVNVVQTGEMQAPTDIGSALMTMFSGDIQTGGQIGQTVGLLAAPIVSSLVGEVGVSGVSTLTGETIAFVGAAGEASAVGVTGIFSTLGLPLAFAGMVLGEMIGGLFEESSPFSKAQQAVIQQHIDIGPYRLQKLHDLGFTDQQIINWIGGHPEENYWYLISLLSTAKGSWVASKINSIGFWEPSDRLILNGVFTIEEKEWLDSFAHDLGFDIETGVEAGSPMYYQRTWADVEGSVGGWHNEYLSLDEAYQKYLASQPIITFGPVTGA
jgi:hypothetical protein